MPGCHIPGLSLEAIKILRNRAFSRLSIIFNGKMLSILGLTYSIILDNRSLPPADQKIILSARNNVQLSNVVNSFFRPEIRVPKMVGIKSDEYTIHKENYNLGMSSSSSSDSDEGAYGRDFFSSSSDSSDSED